MQLITVEEENLHISAVQAELLVARAAIRHYMAYIQAVVMATPDSDLGAANYVVARKLDSDLQEMGVK